MLRGHEVTVKWVVAVEAHSAMHMLGGSDDTGASFGSKELRNGELFGSIEAFIEASWSIIAGTLPFGFTFR